MHTRQPTLKDLLKRCALLINQHIDLQLKAQGLARSQFQVLWLTRHESSLSQKQLANRLGVSEATLSEIIDSLAAKGYVARRPNPADKRVNVLVLTAGGRRMVDRLPNPAEAVTRHMLEGLSKAEVAQLTAGVERIIANLENNM